MGTKELWVSPPGTGKTSQAIEIFRKQILKSKSGIDNRSFFILPSREHAERIQNLILKRDVPGLFNVHVLTINEFQSRFMGLSAGCNPNDTIRRGILRNILKESSFKFPYFEPVKEAKGFHDLVVEAIKEFKASLLTTPEFEIRAEPLLKDPVFKAKFQDFTVLWKNYELELKRLGLQEPEDSIGPMTKLMRHSHSRGRVFRPADLVIFDGFYHFTRAQERLIEVVAAWSKRVIVTLTMSVEGASATEASADVRQKFRRTLFEYPERTRAFLLSVGFTQPLRAGAGFSHRTQEAALLHLEKNIFAEAPVPFKGKQNSVMLFRASSARTEIEMIARRIRRLYRQEASLDYSDVCLILRSLRGYEKIIEAVFAEFEIPVTIHERKRLIEHGFSKTLHHFLNLTAQGWKREDVMAVTRSSYLASRFAPREVLKLGSQVLAENIIEGRERWKAFAPLKDLFETESALCLSKNIQEFNRKLLLFVRSFCVAGAVDEQVLGSLESILRSAEIYYETAKSRDFSGARFMAELQESLEAGLFSMKPKGKNRVQVYDVVMALPKEYKVVFLAGLLEKKFPLAVSEDALFKDAERRVINAHGGRVLEERIPRIAGERYFFYMGLTRASERLFLSYPIYDSDGKPASASFFVEEAERCFEGGIPQERKEPDEIVPEFEEWESQGDAKRGLAATLFAPSERNFPTGLAGLLKHWARRQDVAEILRWGFEGEHAVLKDERTLEAMKRQNGPFSATRLEKFATCAFKYFAGETLNLKEPLEGRENIDMGVLLHKTLEEYYKALTPGERRSGSHLLDSARIEKALHQKLDEAYADPKLHKLTREPAYRQKIYLDSMQKTLALFVTHEKELFEKRRLIPEYFELLFDNLKIEDAGREPIVLRGQIDRVDRVPDSDEALIVDYKRSKRDMSISDKLGEGLEFQLPVYILAAQKLLKLKIVGAEHRLLRAAKVQGLYRDKDGEFEKILQDTECRIRQAVHRIREGEIEVKSKSCDWCHFSPVCRFEKWRLVYSKEENL